MVRKSRVQLVQQNISLNRNKAGTRVTRQDAVSAGEIVQSNTRSSAQVIEEILAGLSWYG